jgi:uncharacterized RDD family membrane protein YckC
MTGFTTSGLTNHLAGDPALPIQLPTPEVIATASNLNSSEVLESTLNLKSTEPDLNAPVARPADADDAEKKNDENSDSWRVELTARLECYRTRRKPRGPRYPSLLLPFDAPQSWPHSFLSTGTEEFASASATARAAVDFGSQSTEEWLRAEPEQNGSSQAEPADQFANVIEFPRSAAIPVFNGSELAEPIFNRPRIVEAPEILPPPPALGGMLIEPAPVALVSRRKAEDCPVDSASISRRVLAAVVDGAILATALAAFAAMFLRLNPELDPVRGPRALLAGALAVVAIIFWMSYEFLFVVYSGSTPGLRVTRLRLARFDGSPVNRRTRRWRVLASFLSAFSAGLGYLGCVLDEEGLCWHDRITRTHMQAAEEAE